MKNADRVSICRIADVARVIFSTALAMSVAGMGVPLMAEDESLTLKGHTDAVSCVAFSPDAKQLASTSFDRTVRLWNAETGEVTHTLKGHTSEVLCVAFSPDAASSSASVFTTRSRPKKKKRCGLIWRA